MAASDRKRPANPRAGQASTRDRDISKDYLRAWAIVRVVFIHVALA